MLLEFVASLALGLGLAGIAMALRFLSAKRIPSYWIPASAGIGMITMMIYLEYSWAERTITRLPEGVVVTGESQESMWYRPWTYVKPLTLRLVAIDTRRHRRHSEQPDQVMTTVILLGRWMPAREIPVVYDCQYKRRADLSADVSLADDGQLIGASWRDLPATDRALEAACAKIDS